MRASQEVFCSVISTYICYVGVLSTKLLKRLSKLVGTNLLDPVLISSIFALHIGSPPFASFPEPHILVPVVVTEDIDKFVVIGMPSSEFGIAP